MFEFHVMFCIIVVGDSFSTFNPLTAGIRYTPHGV